MVKTLVGMRRAKKCLVEERQDEENRESCCSERGSADRDTRYWKDDEDAMWKELQQDETHDEGRRH